MGQLCLAGQLPCKVQDAVMLVIRAGRAASVQCLAHVVELIFEVFLWMISRTGEVSQIVLEGDGDKRCPLVLKLLRINLVAHNGEAAILEGLYASLDEFRVTNLQLCYECTDVSRLETAQIRVMHCAFPCERLPRPVGEAVQRRAHCEYIYYLAGVLPIRRPDHMRRDRSEYLAPESR